MVKRRQPGVEDEVHLLLGRLVHAYARFDLNMGLQLRWLGPYRGVSVDDLLDKSVSFAKRLKMLKRLMLDVFAHNNDEARKAFEGWFKRIERAQALRNDYAHGRWGFDRGLELPDPEFDFIALSWEMDAAKQAPPLRLRLSTFAEQVAAIESLFAEYGRLEDKFVSTARPSLAWEEGIRSGQSQA